MKRNLFVIPIEKIETRYTKHWFDYLPKQLTQNTKFDVHQIESGARDNAPENKKNGFLNFGYTVGYKAFQMLNIVNLFETGLVKNGDVFLFTDYWNPNVASLRYLAAMANIDITVVGICHAGLWDPADLLSQTFGGKSWGTAVEDSLNECFDHLVFATEFSKNLFLNTAQNVSNDKLHVTGFPMEYYNEILLDYDGRVKKEDIIVFPHRKAPEKNIDLFLKLKEDLPQYKFIVALDECTNKEEYHNLLYKSKAVFSAATQETLGISMGIEGPVCGCVPLIPNRLSYAELFKNYSNFYISDDPSYYNTLKLKIVDVIENYALYTEEVKLYRSEARYWFEGKRFYSFLNNL